MTLLLPLSGSGSSAPTTPTTPGDGSWSEIGPEDIRLLAYAPDGSFIGFCDDYDGLNCRRLEFGQEVLSFTLPFESPTLQSSYSGSTAYSRALSGYRFRLMYWGLPFFDGIATVCDDDDEGEGPTVADTPVEVKIECVSWPQWFGTGRMIMGSAGDRYSPGTLIPADDAIKNMWRANTMSGFLIEPSAYSSVLDPTTGLSHNVDRDNFGPYTVQVAANTSLHATSITARWDHGRSLWDNTLEFCRKYDLKPSGSLSGTTYTIDFVDAAGDDLTGSVIFTRERGNLLAFARKVDRGGDAASVAECRGFGRRSTQIVRYAMHKALYDNVGLRETGEVWRSASDADALANAAFLAKQVGGADTHYTAELAESEGQQWGDFDLGDEITIYDSKRGITLEDHITGLELTHNADGLPELRIIVGRVPANEDKKGGRSGGGHGGGHARAGGHPKNADGETLETVIAAGSCITVADVTDQDAGTITYTISASGYSFGAITVDDGTLTPSSCWAALTIVGGRCIEVLKTGASSIQIRNTKYWINKVSVSDPAFTLTADQCDEELILAGSNGISLSGASNTITISGANLHRYATVNGDTGSASASGADTINIIGGDGIKTVAGDGAPDQLAISIRLPQTTSAELDPLYHKVWDAAGNARAVKTYAATS